MPERLTSASAVIVVEDRPPDAQIITQLATLLAHHFTHSEFVFVANAVDSKGALAIKELLGKTLDSTCHFFSQRTDYYTACLVGMDNAISDYVLLATGNAEELKALNAMIRAVREGFDAVIAESETTIRPVKDWYRFLEGCFIKLYNAFTRDVIEADPSPLRLFSRAAALFITGGPHGEMLLRSRTLGSGFPVKVIDNAYPSRIGRPARNLWDAWGQLLRMVVGVGAAPTRLLSGIAMASSATAVLYSLYVFVVYAFKPNVQAGWATLSLQLSGMMLMFSLMLALLSECVTQIYAASSPRRRPIVTRELKSESSRRTGLLNVIDDRGEFQLGAPLDLLPVSGSGGKAEAPPRTGQGLADE